MMLQKKEVSSQKHHYGLNLLCIISTFMIVITHVLGGGLRSTVEGQTDAYFITIWAIQIFCLWCGYLLCSY